MLESKAVYEINVRFYRVIANPRRLQIITLPESGKMNLDNPAGEIGISITNISQLLRILRDSFIVKTRRSVMIIHYGLTDSRLPGACRTIRSRLLTGIKNRSKIVDNIINI